MFIDVELRQGTDINLEFIFFWQCKGQLIIQAVNAFDHQNILFSKFCLFFTVHAFAAHKIKNRQMHALSCKQCVHVIVKLLNIDGFQTFVVWFPIFIHRCVFPVYKIVIHRDRMRSQSVCGKLDRKPMRKGRLSGRRRTGDHNDLFIWIFGDLSGNLRNFLFLKCLLNQDQVMDAMVHNIIIQ